MAQGFIAPRRIDGPFSSGIFSLTFSGHGGPRGTETTENETVNGGGGGQLNTQNRKTEGDALLPEGPPAGPSRECGCRPCPHTGFTPVSPAPGMAPEPSQCALLSAVCEPRLQHQAPRGPRSHPRRVPMRLCRQSWGSFGKGTVVPEGHPQAPTLALGQGGIGLQGTSESREPTGAGAGGRSSGRGGGRPAPRLQAPPGRGPQRTPGSLRWDRLQVPGSLRSREGPQTPASSHLPSARNTQTSLILQSRAIKRKPRAALP